MSGERKKLLEYIEASLDRYNKYLNWANEDGDNDSQQYCTGCLDAIKELERDLNFILGGEENGGSSRESN